MNSFNNVFGTVEMNTRVEFDEKTLVIKDTFLRKDTYGITSMLPNQNISVWMAPLPTEIPRTHEHIIIPSLAFSHQPSPWPDPHLKKEKSTSHVHYPHYLFLSRPTRGTTLLKKNLRKNGKMYWRSFQSSQITPRSLQQSLSLIYPLPTQAPPPPPITALPSSPSPLTTISHVRP